MPSFSLVISFAAEPAEIKLPACRYCISLAEESLGHEDLCSGEIGWMEKTHGPCLLEGEGDCRATKRSA